MRKGKCDSGRGKRHTVRERERKERRRDRQKREICTDELREERHTCIKREST